MTTPSSRQGITMGKYKTKSHSGRFKNIHAYPGIFRHIQTYSTRHNQACSGIFRTLCNPDKFRTLANSEPDAYSEPWYIQNPGLFRTSGIFMTLIYSEPRHIYNPSMFRTPEHFAKIVNILSEINTIPWTFLIQVSFLPQQHLFYVENAWGPSGPGTINFDIS